MSFLVEKNIPVPVVAGSRGKYPFREMAVGDSFLVPQADCKNIHARIHACAQNIRRSSSGFKIATRRVEGGQRVWRIA